MKGFYYKKKYVVRVLLALVTCHLSLVTLTAHPRFLRNGCIGHASSNVAGGPNRLPLPPTQWDSLRTYPIAVVLVSFSDREFSQSDPAAYYDRLFNEHGYNEGIGPGCVADYFHDQSRGLFRPRFDVYGPVSVGTASTENGTYGVSTFRNATLQLADIPGMDFAPYDWDGDGRAEAFVFVFAGYCGNEQVNIGKGYIWPNTGSFQPVSAGGATAQDFSASAELWANNTLCGIGTICHEYSHTLGLPDLYPTSGSEYSVVDEWDLMDGGNFADGGWCPPNYSVHERMLLGWIVPEMLNAPLAIEGLVPIADGGKAYRIDTGSPSEFFLLENRQWSGWDAATPGHGLLVAHVDYKVSRWLSNTVNTLPSHHCYDLVHADNLDYNAWDRIVGNTSPYVGAHSRILSGTAYPHECNDGINDKLTDNSTPAAVTYGEPGVLSKPLTSIVERADGSIAFQFMGSMSQAVSAMCVTDALRSTDLLGRSGAACWGLVVKNGRKILFNNTRK